MRSLIIATLMVLAASVANAQGCPLTGITPQTWTANQEFNGGLSSFVWYLSPCTTTFPTGQAPCPSSVGYFGQWDIKKNGGDCQSLMDVQTTKWVEFTSSAGPGYTSEFTSSTKNTATVIILCDSSASNLQAYGNVIATKIPDTNPQTYNYKATMKSNACGASTPMPATSTPTAPVTPLPPGETAAPTTPAPASQLPSTPSPTVNHTGGGGGGSGEDDDMDSGCGGGCVFLLILGIGSVVYAVGAVAWNFRIGKRGKELAPHPEFWMECVALVKEGCIFFAQAVCSLVDKCRGKSGGGGSSGEGSYSSV